MRSIISVTILYSFALNSGVSTEVSAPTAKAINSFAVRNVRVFDGDRSLEHMTVVVEGGLIAAIGSGSSIPSGIQVFDGRGKTLMPGLIDSHVHVSKGAQRDALRFGVTTELDMFNASHHFAHWRTQRDSLEPSNEADTWSAGTGITAPGGHPTEMGGPAIPTLARTQDAAAFVDDRVSEGSDYIKLILEDGSEYGPKFHFNTLSRQQIEACVDEATLLGKMTIAHIATEESARLAVESGVRGLAHMFFDHPADPEFIALARQRHIFIISTLSIQAGVSGTNVVQALVDDPSVAPFLSAKQKATLAIPYPSMHPERLLTEEANVHTLFKAGVPILAGTDAPIPQEADGVTLHQELLLLVQSGLTPMQALSAATAKPAAVFSLWDRGRVAVGLRADLLLIDGDPTVDISRTRHLDRIWKNGYPVQRLP